MDHNLQQTLAEVVMFSKMGRYITNKVMKYTKRGNLHTALRGCRLPNQGLKKSKEMHKVPKHSIEKPKTAIVATAPSVGFYKVSYKQVDKNGRSYNFERSMPHFAADRHFCNESSHVLYEVPESVLCHGRVTGFTQIARMTSRSDIKGSVRWQP
jgi:hypothetical protein